MKRKVKEIFYRIKIFSIKKMNRILNIRFYLKRNLSLGKDILFGKDVQIECKYGKVRIGEKSSVWEYSKIISAGGQIEIGKNVQVGAFCWITGQGNVEIGDNVILADKVNIISANHKFNDIAIPIRNQGSIYRKIMIGEGSWLGVGATILSGVNIGKNCVIGANAVVNKDVPDYSVVAGNPAKVIKKYDKNTQKWIKL